MIPRSFLAALCLVTACAPALLAQDIPPEPAASAEPAAEAETTPGASCRATVNATEVTIPLATDAETTPSITRRETLMNWPGNALSRWRGKAPACNSAQLIAYLGQTVPVEDIDGYCLTPSDTGDYLLVPGPRNYRGQCRKTTCERVNASKADALAMTGAMAGKVGAVVTHPGVKAVSHGSGAMILSGTGAAITGTLTTAGSTVLGALAAPVALTAAAVSVVAVGGALYVCQE